jgi:N-acetylglucosaminyldiphosphoundecaprenol N-acetyl-beta-D-mannosaminyltransferase
MVQMSNFSNNDSSLSRCISEKIRSTTNIFGIKIHDLSLVDLLDLTLYVVQNNHKMVVSNVNIHALNIAYENPWFKEYLNWSNLVFCDGYGVVLGSRIIGPPLHHRYTPPDWIDLLIEKGSSLSVRYFFLGSEQGITQKAGEILQTRHPRLVISGTHHGYFDRTPNSDENKAIIRQINDSNTNILMVGFGMPLQEQWIWENYDQLNVNVIFPVGAMFDFISGHIWRAPRWVTDNGLEWAGRLINNFPRLWRRYLIGNPLFFSRVIFQKIRMIGL